MRRDGLLLAVAVGIAGIYLYATWQLPTLAIGDPLGPKIFPTLIGLLMVLSCIVLVWEMARNSASQTRVLNDLLVDPDDRPMAVGAVWLWLLLFVTLFELAGFVIAGTLFLFGFFAYFNRTKLGMNLTLSILLPITVYVIFKRFLGIPLPSGPLLWF